MVLAMDFRRQAQVCARLAADCEDRQLAERFRKMTADCCRFLDRGWAVRAAALGWGPLAH
jgi:hypothetical protein